MRLVATVLPCLLFLFVCQSPQDTIRKHYETAEAQRAAGNLAAAEAEYTAILGEGYERLGEIYLALEDHRRAITVLEAAAAYRPNSQLAGTDRFSHRHTAALAVCQGPGNSE